MFRNKHFCVISLHGDKTQSKPAG